MKTIFMTGAGGAGTIAAARKLKESNKYRIILGDMDPWAAGLRFADKSYVLPAGKEEIFIDRVKDIIRKERVSVFIPLVDEEILKSYALKEKFPDLVVLLPDYNFTKMALDKYKLISKLKENAFNYPKTYLASSKEVDLVFPIIVKPRHGRGSRGVMEVNNNEQLRAYREFYKGSGDKTLLQEKLSGKEFTISVVVNKRGDILAVVPKEVIFKRGITITAVTRASDAIRDLCIEIQHRLRANGPFNVQLIIRKDGRPVIFEINPRYSTTLALTLAAGVNEIELLVENYNKYAGGLVPFKENLVMSRYYEQVYFEEKCIFS